MIPKLIHSLNTDKYIRLNKVKNRWYRPNIFDCRFYLYFFLYILYLFSYKDSVFFPKWHYLLLNFKKNQMIAGNINKNTNMKQTIKLRESELKRVIAESVKRVLKESGDTKRGSYLMGRAGKRNLIRGDISNFIDKRDKASNKDAFNQGMEDQTAYGINLKDPSRDSTWDMRNNRRLKFNYNTYKTEDMDELGRKFIDFIEKYDGGVLMDTVVDYESGNQTGKKESPLKEIIPYFEEEVLGYDCTPDMIDAIRRAYNQWWFYAEDQLMPYDEDEEVVYESINRKINRIVSESIRRNLR